MSRFSFEGVDYTANYRGADSALCYAAHCVKPGDSEREEKEKTAEGRGGNEAGDGKGRPVTLEQS